VSDAPLKLVAGLGNPGRRYERTRHNAGRLTLEALAWLNNLAFTGQRHGARLAEGRIRNQPVLLVEPDTYMNRSGEPLRQIQDDLRLFEKDILVICDDTSLPPGRIRFRSGGSSGGHRGLESVAMELGTEDYPRLRLGVGAPPADLEFPDYVLGEFAPGEWPVFHCALIHAALGVERWLEKGLDFCMNVFNRK
jgi:PTH1 family peptidyl-tRNA hydrolase